MYPFLCFVCMFVSDESDNYSSIKCIKYRVHERLTEQLRIDQICKFYRKNVSKRNESEKQWLLNSKVGRFKSEHGPDPQSKGSGTCIKTSNYTWPGSCIKMVLPKATVTSPGWGVVYPTELSLAAI